MNPSNIYPRTGDTQTVYLNQVVTDPSILVGDYTMYNDFVNDPIDFEKNNVLYHYPVNHDRLVIGKFCSIACGVKFLFNRANHSLKSLSTYPFPIFFEAWGLNRSQVAKAWDNRRDRWRRSHHCWSCSGGTGRRNGSRPIWRPFNQDGWIKSDDLLNCKIQAALILNDTKQKISPSENLKVQREVWRSRSVSSVSALAAGLQNRL